MAQVQQIYKYLDEKYPFSLQEGFDNSGFLIGSPHREVRHCAVALDVTASVLKEAAARDAQLIITHHPVIFHPLKSLCAGSIAYECVRLGMAVLSSHTCLDKAPGGINDILAGMLGLTDVTVAEDGLLRQGVLAEPESPEEFASRCRKMLSADGVRAVLGDRPVKKVAICSGAGGSYVEDALLDGCDALLTGEVKHHEAVFAQDNGLTVVDAGHFETETVVVPALIRELSEAFPEVSFFEPEANRPLFCWVR